MEQILCVSLDIHKYFHVVIIHNALGEIVTPTFEIDIFQTGFEQLCQAIDEAINSNTWLACALARSRCARCCGIRSSVIWIASFLVW